MSTVLQGDINFWSGPGDLTATAASNDETSTKSPEKVRASITFRLSTGTKSRDFPGRSFTIKERNLLKVWSAEWRRGESVVKATDLRFINLHSEEHGKRKKVMNKSIIRRIDAYQWFREKHILLMSAMSVMKDSKVNPPKVSSLVVAGCVPNSIISNQNIKQFIEVKWDDASQKLISDSKEKLFVIWLQCASTHPITLVKTTSILPVYLMRQGLGGFFSANELPVGKHIINGSAFTVIQNETIKDEPVLHKTSSRTTTSSSSDGSSTKQAKKKQEKKRKRPSSTATKKSTVAAKKVSDSSSKSGVKIARLGKQKKDIQQPFPRPFSSSSAKALPEALPPNVIIFGSSTAYDLLAVHNLRKSLGRLVTHGPHSKFREVVGDVALYRFLLDANGDQKKAVTSFKNHLKMRYEHSLDKHRYRIEKQQPNGVFTEKSVRSFHLSSVIHFELMNQFIRHFAGMTIEGSPIHMFWIDTTAMLKFLDEKMGSPTILLEFIAEIVVRGQLQLDFLSQQQDRLVQSLVIINGATESIWRTFMLGKYRSAFQSMLKMVASPPAIVYRIFWMDPTWYVRAFYTSFLTLFPTKLHSKISFLSDKDLSSSILSTALDVNTRHILNQLRNAGGFDQDLLSSDKQEREVQISAGSIYETIVKVDAAQCQKVSWKFTIERGSSLDFTIIMLRNISSKGDKTINSNRSSFSKINSNSNSNSSSSSSSSGSGSSSSTLNDEANCLHKMCISKRLGINGTEQDVYNVPKGTTGIMLFQWSSEGGFMRWGTTSLLYHIETLSSSDVTTGIDFIHPQELHRSTTGDIEINEIENDNNMDVSFNDEMFQHFLEASQQDGQLTSNFKEVVEDIQIDVNGNILMDSTDLLHEENVSGEGTGDFGTDSGQREEGETNDEDVVMNDNNYDSNNNSTSFNMVDTDKIVVDETNRSNQLSSSHQQGETATPTTDVMTQVRSSIGGMCTSEELSTVVSIRGQIQDLIQFYTIELGWLEVVGDMSLLRYVRRSKEKNIMGYVRKIREHIELRRVCKMDQVRSKLKPSQCFGWTQSELTHGTKFQKYMKIIPNVNADSIMTWCRETVRSKRHGNKYKGRTSSSSSTTTPSNCPTPVQFIDNIGIGLRRVISYIGEAKFRECTIEHFIRRQIQIDMLSRLSQQLVQVVCIIRASEGGLWKALVPGVYRNMFAFFSTLRSTVPGIESDYHILDPKWLFRKAYQRLSTTFTEDLNVKVHRDNYHETLLEYLSEKHIALFYSNSSDDTSTDGEDKDTMDFDGKEAKEAKQLLLAMNKHVVYDFFEIALHYDPSKHSGIKWKFIVKDGSKINFEITIIRGFDIADPGNSLCVRVPVFAPPLFSNSGDGTIPYPLKQQGLIILKWSINTNCRIVNNSKGSKRATRRSARKRGASNSSSGGSTPNGKANIERSGKTIFYQAEPLLSTSPSDEDVLPAVNQEPDEPK